jgi:hypothetical protein
MNEPVFIVPVHVKRAEKSIMPESISGAYVSCYTVSETYQFAVKKCLAALQSDGMYTEKILQPISMIRTADWEQHVLDQWPSYIGQMPNQSEFEAAMMCGDVVYGPFGSY